MAWAEQSRQRCRNIDRQQLDWLDASGLSQPKGKSCHSHTTGSSHLLAHLRGSFNRPATEVQDGRCTTLQTYINPIAHAASGTSFCLLFTTVQPVSDTTYARSLSHWPLSVKTNQAHLCLRVSILHLCTQRPCLDSARSGSHHVLLQYCIAGAWVCSLPPSQSLCTINPPRSFLDEHYRPDT